MNKFIYGFISASVIITLLGYFLFGNRFDSKPQNGLHVDFNDDGVSDVSLELESDNTGFYRELIDKNFDGMSDEKHHYTSNDVILFSEIDDDFDGFGETRIDYLKGSIAEVRVDSNQNGKIDTYLSYDQGVLVTAFHFYPLGEKGDSAFVGSVDFKFSYPSSMEKLVKVDFDEFDFLVFAETQAKSILKTTVEEKNQRP